MEEALGCELEDPDEVVPDDEVDELAGAELLLDVVAAEDEPLRKNINQLNVPSASSATSNTATRMGTLQVRRCRD